MSVAPYESQPGGFLPAQQQAAPPQRRSQAQELAEWAQAAQSAYVVAEQLVGTSFCPAAFRGKPYEATAAILTGSEVGLSPMASLAAFHPIQGTSAPKAITLRAIVQARGHDMWIEEQSDRKVVMAGRRRGSKQVMRSTWTIQRATQAGFVKKNPNYVSQPENMLIARCSSELARLLAADALLGIPYSFEELQDEAGPVQAEAEQVGPRTVRRKSAVAAPVVAGTSPVAAPAPSVSGPPLPGEEEQLEAARNSGIDEPAGQVNALLAESDEVDGIPPHLPGPEPGDVPIDPKGSQMARLQILLKERVGKDRDHVLEWVSKVVHRRVGSTKDLTHAQAAEVIARLEQLPVLAADSDDGGGGS